MPNLEREIGGNEMKEGRPTTRCRVCGNVTYRIIEMKGMPQAVQTLLASDEVEEDRAVGVRVIRCRACGLVQLADDPPRGHYSGDYLFSVNFSEHARAYQKALAERWASDHALSRRRVLEVGGGDGYFAELLTKMGCDVTFVEPSPGACKIARGRPLRRIVEGKLTEKMFPGEVFDVVVLRQVLEHVPRPLRFLRLVRTYLKDGGKVLIEVPNIDSIVEGGRYQDFYAEHLLYFAADTLARAVVMAGLRVREMYTIERGDYLVCAAEAMPSEIDAMTKGIVKYKRDVRSMLESSIKAGRKVGVYGAGGRGVSLLALIGAGNIGVEYVVDSDEKKWGKFTPATHIPVLSPEVLRKNPVDDLLITAIAFQDEILRQLSWFAGSGRRIGVLSPRPRWLEEADEGGAEGLTTASS